MGELFRPDNFFSDQTSSNGNSAVGSYNEQAKEVITDMIRREVEESDNCLGFQFTHSLGGGTGSGLGNLLSEAMRENFPSKMF